MCVMISVMIELKFKYYAKKLELNHWINVFEETKARLDDYKSKTQQPKQDEEQISQTRDAIPITSSNSEFNWYSIFICIACHRSYTFFS